MQLQTDNEIGISPTGLSVLQNTKTFINLFFIDIPIRFGFSDDFHVIQGHMYIHLHIRRK